MLRKTYFLLSLFFMTAFSINAQWKNVKSTAITFKIKNAGIGVDGSFKKASIQLSIDEANPANSFFSGTVEANSIETGINLRNNHLKDKEEFFNVAKYPVLTMKSVSVVSKSPGIYAVTWDLTMKGITKRFTSQVNAVQEGSILHLSTEFRINRNEWNVGGSSITMADMVTVKLKTDVSK